ncbi:reverse transcriptase family protein [Pelomonas sp. P7]|uniref:RNA-directed DNA polymerase n=1 Tax=Pelomonas caseinilytica TaxID=2906763 RepID=A0ABS8XAE4_9BURK|nr:reverse transcriptase family protein [Pelomonas sp. P7]MCE4535803.1 reverse transcriptase family protein [Pelomonas sp. P7]
MRLPHPLLNSQFFQYASLSELLKATERALSESERELMLQLSGKGLPPISSRAALAAMLGINEGLIWSFEARPGRHYRTFYIPKGKDVRRIDAPRVALKIVQKWIGFQLAKAYLPPEHVCGFVEGRSHIDAARIHCRATWVFGVDIQNFFPTTPIDVVARALLDIGYHELGAVLISRLCCFENALAQGAPSSPILSNMCFASYDQRLKAIADRYGARLTRYADDIVFSGQDDFPVALKEEVLGIFASGPWALSNQKIKLAVWPQRLKVHGLLVHGDQLRLTKGYRNRLRAYEHLLAAGKIRAESISVVRGHLGYKDQVAKRA